MQNQAHKRAQVAGSFRDPSGTVFKSGDTIYRQIQKSYGPHYEVLMSSGLYQKLVERHLLIEHEEVSLDLAFAPDPFKVVRPRQLSFISYPYEWCFSQLKDAALATLDIHLQALEYGMVLKDASAFNIQFDGGRPLFIDTLSFAKYEEGTPWVAYKQFCEHFLAPLALMAFRGDSLNQLLKIHLDGIPLDVALSLLPASASLRFGIFLHLRVHAVSQKKMAGKKVDLKDSRSPVTKESIKNLALHLRGTVEKLELGQGKKTAWSHYYEEDLVGDEYFEHKKSLVKDYVKSVPGAAMIWDLGANRGEFSQIVASPESKVVSWDFDAACVEFQYRQLRDQGEKQILPLVLDLMNPTPALGWGHTERLSFAERGPADLILALALVHHLAIAGNVPLEHIASFFKQLGKHLVIEFVPKSDKRVQQLLNAREDIFTSYTPEGFEAIFSKHFEILKKNTVRGSERVLYLLKRRG